MTHFKVTGIRVTKLDAARRQLQTAIQVWFNDGDPIAIHALAFAAHEIIHAICRKRGHADLMFDSTVIKEEHRGEFGRLLKENATFFKHAQKDTDATIDFNPGMNDLFISMSVAALLRMKENMHDLELAFNLWNVIHKTHLYTESEKLRDGRLPIPDLQIWKSLDKPNFLRRYLVIRRKGVEI